METKGQNILRGATFGDKLRQRAYALTVFIAVLTLATAVTFIAFSTGGADVGSPTEDVGVKAMVFSAPVKMNSGEEIEVSKSYSATELYKNLTLGHWEAHLGLDFKAVEGTDVIAAYAGKVVSVEDHPLLGSMVTIDHGNGVATVYASLQNEKLVAVNDVVVQGQVIGKIGNTSSVESADGPHLHFEVRENGIEVNPEKYLKLDNK
ncbi:MAG: M23 family metallopeptidase [Firmicutes bacterium]|nr:M23 family metallopeptidase [Bacillota bacterium]